MCNKVIIPNSSVMLLRLITAATAISDGYDLGVVNGVSLILSNKYEPKVLSFFVATMPVFVAVGALIGGFASDKLGRKPVLIFSYVLLIVGALIMGLPIPDMFLFPGRAIVGLGVGIGAIVGTVYMAEVAPTKNRGSLVAQESLFLSCGLLLGYLSNYLLMNVPNNYHVMLGLGAFLPLCCLIALVTVGRSLPESPHWQRMRQQSESPNMETDSLILNSTQATISNSSRDNDKSMSEVFRAFLKTPGAASAVMIGVLQPLAGVGVLLYFSDLTFSQVEASGLQEGAIVETKPEIAASSIYIGLTKVAVLFFSTLILMDRVGRRTLLMISSVLLILSYGGIIFALETAAKDPRWLLVAFCAAIGSYAFGWNCVPSVYPSEMLPTHVRTFGISFITVMGRIISVANAFLYPLVGLNNPKTWFLVFGCINIVSLALVFFFTKETLNKPLMVKESQTTSDSEREELAMHVDDDDALIINKEAK
jgi:MFS family permease